MFIELLHVHDTYFHFVALVLTQVLILRESVSCIDVIIHMRVYIYAYVYNVCVYVYVYD